MQYGWVFLPRQKLAKRVALLQKEVWATSLWTSKISFWSVATLVDSASSCLCSFAASSDFFAAFVFFSLQHEWLWLLIAWASVCNGFSSLHDMCCMFSSSSSSSSLLWSKSLFSFNVQHNSIINICLVSMLFSTEIFTDSSNKVFKTRRSFYSRLFQASFLGPHHVFVGGVFRCSIRDIPVDWLIRMWSIAELDQVRRICCFLNERNTRKVCLIP